jgi:thioredoxin reductase
MGIAVAAASLAFAGSAALRARAASAARAADRRAPAKLAAPVRVRLPQIDTSTCLGCYACVDACPFDVLAIDKYLAVVERPADCCGVGTCEKACPNGSLRIAEGEILSERPRVGETLESEDAPGVFVAGDLTGLPLIKNAIAQGVRAMNAVAEALPRGARRAGGDVADVVVVGAGPAGLSAALRAKELGLSCVVLEQGSIAASIRSFPRDKVVFDPPLDVPVEGPLWLEQCTKEELLAQWTRITRRHGVAVREGHRVTGVAREGDVFAVTATTTGDRAGVVRGRKLVLAIGRRGTPRPLDAAVAADAEGKVSYALYDARSFAGKRVLVVGLGDAAMEAASAIARQPGADVTIAYRGDGFHRGKARNVAEVKTFVAAGRIRLLFGSTVDRVEARSVTLSTPSGTETLANDAVIVLIGGVPSWDLVEAAGVRRARAPGRPAPIPASSDRSFASAGRPKGS